MWNQSICLPSNSKNNQEITAAKFVLASSRKFYEEVETNFLIEKVGEILLSINDIPSDLNLTSELDARPKKYRPTTPGENDRHL